jgi:AraC family transcriptional regulator
MRRGDRKIDMRTRLPISYGNEFAKCFYLSEAPSLLMKPLSRSQLAATRLTLKQGLPEPSASVHPEKAFTIAVHLIDPVFQGWGTWVAGKFLKVDSWRAGGIGIYDLESDPRALRNSPFDSVHYNLPRTTLDGFTEDAGLPKVDTLLCDQGTRDDVLYHLTLMLLPYLGPNNQLSDLFFDNFVLMFCTRLVETYGSVRTSPTIHRGGLAPWQMRRTRELLDQHPAGNLRLQKLAEECGLSLSHFARSFKHSFGSSVHRYLLLQRVEAAQSLLLHSDHSLATIALESGFSDQASFSRTFGAIVGTSPGRWRRQCATRHIQTERPNS